jgi:hypothetical protein
MTVWGSKDHCPNCLSSNPYRFSNAPDPRRPFAAKVERKTGDWDCERCKAMNFARNTQCFKCKTFRDRPPAPPTPVSSNDDTTCVVCMDARREVILPCKHVVMCEGCAKRVTACPLCTAEYSQEGIVRVYL